MLKLAPDLNLNSDMTSYPNFKFRHKFCDHIRFFRVGWIWVIKLDKFLPALFIINMMSKNLGLNVVLDNASKFWNRTLSLRLMCYTTNNLRDNLLGRISGYFKVLSNIKQWGYCSHSHRLLKNPRDCGFTFPYIEEWDFLKRHQKGYNKAGKTSRCTLLIHLFTKMDWIRWLNLKRHHAYPSFRICARKIWIFYFIPTTFSMRRQVILWG